MFYNQSIIEQNNTDRTLLANLRRTVRNFNEYYLSHEQTLFELNHLFLTFIEHDKTTSVAYDDRRLYPFVTIALDIYHKNFQNRNHKNISRYVSMLNKQLEMGINLESDFKHLKDTLRRIKETTYSPFSESCRIKEIQSIIDNLN